MTARHITPAGRGLGWRPSLPRHGRAMFGAPMPIGGLPTSVDLRPNCPPVYDQGQLGCHDSETEVLTDTGWQKWADISGRELLGTMSPISGQLEFQAPLALHRYQYDGPLIGIDHRSLDFALTPNHRMWLRCWDERARSLRSDYAFTDADKIGWYAGLPATTSGWRGVDLDVVSIGGRSYAGDDFLAIVALIASDGWVGGTESNWNTVSFCCFRPDRRVFVDPLAYRLGLHPIPSRDGVWKWTDAALAQWLRANMFTADRYRSPFKRVPNIVKAASERQINHFLTFFGDQSTASANRMFYSASRHMIDDLQELLLRTGRRGSIYEREPRSNIMRDGRRIDADICVADITLVERMEDTRLSIMRKHQITSQPYVGEVFCATVPNGLLVTRRNGSILISGNSCTGNALAFAVQFERMRQNLADAERVPSRLMIYYLEREIEGTIDSDSGAQGYDGIAALQRTGVCFEDGPDGWPYDVTKFAQQPPQNCYTAAALDKVVQDYSVPQDINQMRACLAAGFPFCFGFTVYPALDSDQVAQTGLLPMPGPNEQDVGGHEVTAVGYDDANRLFLIRNSWGPNWAQGGYFWMPYEYVMRSDLASELVTVRLVEGPAAA